jgi:iron(III) transport system permease protein
MPLSVLIWSLLHSGVESQLAGVALVMLGAVAAAGGLAAWALGRLVRRREALQHPIEIPEEFG